MAREPGNGRAGVGGERTWTPRPAGGMRAGAKAGVRWTLVLAALLAGALPRDSGAAQELPDPTGLDSGAAPAQTAWLDDTAQRLILGARAARDTALLQIDSYTAVVRERTWVEMPLGRRTASFIEGEYASRVRWSQGQPTIVRVLGRRARSPFLPAERADSIWSPRTEFYAANPIADPFSFAVLALARGRPLPFELIRSPLEEGSERFYHFRSGDTLTISLPEGRVVQAVQVAAIPRARSVRLVSAILWIEPESFGLVRVAYRIAKRIDRELSFSFTDGRGRFAPGLRLHLPALEGEVGLAADSSAEDESDPDERPATPRDRLSSLLGVVGGLYSAAIPPVAMDFRAVVVDYQLRDLRYWLPRAVRWEGTAGLAEDVLPDGTPTTPFPYRMDWAFEIEEVREAGTEEAATVAEIVDAWTESGDRVEGIEEAGPGDVVIVAPRSQEALRSSEALPPPMREGGIGAPDDATVNALADELAEFAPAGEKTDEAAALEASPWLFEPPFRSLRLLRYNDVEGLSAGTRLARGFGRTWASLTVRAGLDSREVPDMLFTLSRGLGGVRVVGRAYRSLGIPQDGPFVRGAELTDYSWSQGTSLLLLPADGRRNWISLEGFAARETELDGSGRLDRYGTELRLRPWWGGRNDLGAGLEAMARLVRGDNPHRKASAALAAVLPLSAGLSLGLEAGGAGLWGEARRRDFWTLGGTGRWLRGHEGVTDRLESHQGTLRARTIWRGRTALHWQIPRFGPLRNLGPLGFRLSPFADWARAWGVDHAAWGVGLATADGLLRLDLARGIELETPGLTLPKWRVHLLGGLYF